jgi:Flp pilus assembly protein TadG
MRRKFAMLIRCYRGCEAGTAAVEFALTALPVILIALGTFDYFAANYEITALEAAARALGEYARDAPSCAGQPTSTTCTNAISSLFTTMQTNNNSLSGATQSTSTYYTCADNSGTSTSPPTCNVSGDTRVIEYVQVTVTESSWRKMFSWDPWSSLTARMSTRVQ